MHRALSIALIPVLAIAGLRPAAEPLTFLRAIEMPGVKGRIDHLAVDLSSGRIFVAALGNDTVEVIDGRPGARTSLYVPDESRLYLAVPLRGAQKSEIRVYDLHD